MVAAVAAICRNVRRDGVIMAGDLARHLRPNRRGRRFAFIDVVRTVWPSTEQQEDDTMAAIHHEESLAVDAADAWAALRQVGHAQRLFAPVLSEGFIEGDVRTVTFANGMVVREHVLDIDEARRRVAYTVLDGPGLTFHHASMQVLDDGPGRCRFCWITDFLPAEAAGALTPLIQQGSAALKTNLEGAPSNA
jgi:hypothetical protein